MKKKEHSEIRRNAKWKEGKKDTHRECVCV